MAKTYKLLGIDSAIYAPNFRGSQSAKISLHYQTSHIDGYDYLLLAMPCRAPSEDHLQKFNISTNLETITIFKKDASPA